MCNCWLNSEEDKIVSDRYYPTFRQLGQKIDEQYKSNS